MVRERPVGRVERSPLSVLALSSRFDGPVLRSCATFRYFNFQYSLCRVVLMVRRI